MSNHNEFHLGNEIGFGIIISRRGEELFALTTKHNLQVFPHHHQHRKGRQMCLLKNDFSEVPSM